MKILLALAASVFFLSIVLLLYSGNPEVLSPVPDGQVLEVRDEMDELVRSYLERKGSPLAVYASELVAAADEFDIQPASLVAIAGVESGFGRAHLCGSHNPFGYGSPCHDFRSFPDAFRRVARTIATSRYYRDYQESGETRDLARVYNEGNEEKWQRDYDYFLAEMAAVGELKHEESLDIAVRQ